MVQADAEMCAFCFDTIIAELKKTPKPEPAASIPAVELPLFVTWKKGPSHNLRGCIGTFSDLNIRDGLAEYAKISAFRDTRFKPVKLDEVSSLQCGVSLLIDFEPAKNYKDWTVGVHGVRINATIHGFRLSAVFLPEVAADEGWDHTVTMDHLIRKGGFNGPITEDVRLALNVVRFKSSKFILDYATYERLRS